MAQVVRLGAALAAALLWAGVAAAEEPRAFVAANEAYAAGRYDDAARGYRALLQAGQDSAAVYFNLGNALLKSQRPAEAVWAYRNAAARDPRDADIRANLEHARSLLPRSDEASVRPPAAVEWLTFGGRWTTRELAIVWILCLWIAAICRALADWWPPAAAAGRGVGFAFGVGAVALAALIAQTAGVDAVRRAVVTASEATVRFAPQATGTVHFTLPAGAVVRVRQALPGWTQVQRADGRSGWIPDGTIAPLDRGA